MRDLAQATDKPMVEPKSREDRIREAAYLRYLARGESESDASIDWVGAPKWRSTLRTRGAE